MLASRIPWEGKEQEGAMNVVTDFGFGTVCSSLVALPSPANPDSTESAKPIFLFAAGRPDEALFKPVATSGNGTAPA